MVTLDERLRTRIKLQCQGREEIDIYKKKLAQYKNYFSNHCYKGTVVNLYLQFLEIYGNVYYINMAPVVEQISRGIFDVYDIAAMLIIYYRALQRNQMKNLDRFLLMRHRILVPLSIMLCVLYCQNAILLLWEMYRRMSTMNAA